MLKAINPKLPMRNKENTIHYYVNQLGFSVLADFDDYLLLEKDNVEIHFFLFKTLDPANNYGQVYFRTDDIESLYKHFIVQNIEIHPNAPLALKPWGQKEFSLLDPDNNLLTFGQTID